jgi:hypothetical protein
MHLYVQKFFSVYFLLILNIPRYVVEERCFFDLAVRCKRMNCWVQNQSYTYNCHFVAAFLIFLWLILLHHCRSHQVIWTHSRAVHLPPFLKESVSVEINIYIYWQYLGIYFQIFAFIKTLLNRCSKVRLYDALLQLYGPLYIHSNNFASFNLIFWQLLKLLIIHFPTFSCADIDNAW